MKRALSALAFAGVLVSGSILAQVGTSHAASGSGTFTPRQGHFGGIVPPYNGSHPYHAGGSGDLAYHGGPVMHTNALYAIFWDPSGLFSSLYESSVEGWMQNVAADSGHLTNTFSVATQYGDGGGKFSYGISYGGAGVDTQAYPTSGCPIYSGVIECLTDAQIQTEIDRYRISKGWPSDLAHEYVLYTPYGIGSCFDSGGSTCAYTAYCAYHSPTNAYGTVYSNMPYPESIYNDCDQGQHPNGSKGQGAADADAVINVTSHELIESITDPNLTAWYDNAGYEIGDKCAWQFGTLQGSSGAQYSQTINGANYFEQEEYSNQIHDCPQFSPFVTLNPSSAPHAKKIPIKLTVGGMSWGGQVKVTFGTGKKATKFNVDAYGNAWTSPLNYNAKALKPGTYTLTVTDAKTGASATATFNAT